MNEDFVTFELAKKLKEKGFRKLCLYHFKGDKVVPNEALYSAEGIVATDDLYAMLNCWDEKVDAPTIPKS